jgi:hypothetical protein
MGTEHSVTTVRFQEAEFHWPLFSNEFEEVTVASVPEAEVAGLRKRPFNVRVEFRQPRPVGGVAPSTNG